MNSQEKSVQTRKQNGSYQRLHTKYRWVESLNASDLILKVINTNMTDVAKELNIPRHILSGHLKRNGFEQEKTFKRSNPSWIKGLTKETDSRVNVGAEKISETRKQLFKEGKLQQPDAFMTPDQIKERQNKSEQTRLEKYGNGFGPASGWNAGLTKEDNPIIAKAAKKQSVTRKAKIASGEINMWGVIKASKFDHTSIELAIEQELKNRGIPFETQKVLFNKFLVDAVIEESKIVIFADGCYWHGCLEHKVN
jgi:hypothetical protein